MSTTSNSPVALEPGYTPITHRIADKAPEFPCWLWHQGNHLMCPGWYDSRTMIQSWLPAPGHTHWCHSAERPTHAPESQVQGDSEMLDALRELTNCMKRLRDSGQSYCGPVVLERAQAAIASAMKGGDR